MVAGLTILRLVDQGFLTLDSTTGDVLGWTGPQAAITLRQLLSFTSGLPREAPCTLLAEHHARGLRRLDLADDAGGGAGHALRLRQHPSARGGAHGGSGHRANRGPMFSQAQLKTPLGLGADMTWYTAPRQGTGTTNPLIAGGLRATMNEYARVLQLEFNRGVYQGNRLISDALFTAQATEPFPTADDRQLTVREHRPQLSLRARGLAGVHRRRR